MATDTAIRSSRWTDAHSKRGRRSTPETATTAIGAICDRTPGRGLRRGRQRLRRQHRRTAPIDAATFYADSRRRRVRGCRQHHHGLRRSALTIQPPPADDCDDDDDASVQPGRRRRSCDSMRTTTATGMWTTDAVDMARRSTRMQRRGWVRGNLGLDSRLLETSLPGTPTTPRTATTARRPATPGSGAVEVCDDIGQRLRRRRPTTGAEPDISYVLRGRSTATDTATADTTTVDSL